MITLDKYVLHCEWSTIMGMKHIPENHINTDHNELQTDHNELQTDHNELQTDHNDLQTKYVNLMRRGFFKVSSYGLSPLRMSKISSKPP